MFLFSFPFSLTHSLHVVVTKGCILLLQHTYFTMWCEHFSTFQVFPQFIIITEKFLCSRKDIFAHPLSAEALSIICMCTYFTILFLTVSLSLLPQTLQSYNRQWYWYPQWCCFCCCQYYHQCRNKNGILHLQQYPFFFLPLLNINRVHSYILRLLLHFFRTFSWNETGII